MKYYPMFDLFDDFFTGNTTSDVMKTDIVEKDGNYEMSMELPGVKKEDIQMELKDGYLKVTATHGSNTEDKDEKGRVVRKERVSGSYSRSFYVGDSIRDNDIQASFKDGILTITVPTEEHKEEIRNLIESKIGKKLDIDVRQVEEGRRFEDSFVDIEKLINMDIVVEDD